MDSEAIVPSVPIHVVTHASQLPEEFLQPSREKQMVIGFDCEGEDLCRQGALCIMQVFVSNLFEVTCSCLKKKTRTFTDC